MDPFKQSHKLKVDVLKLLLYQFLTFNDERRCRRVGKEKYN